ncbi:HEAT repeat domain-containing protein [Actinomycetospora cinnamomea]|uniref:HEAT repeat protein n=1 Tax=Actinomycetospora cinnamomea TaxID=663609 RepID=A0A2U1FQZ9_9PSEU|nr:HEAT repeat domain-containing protein [Actinomycetospora cinnamomea]PVZ14576.1 HEAT repeat protein [Actinomycetospora cinnamomea]
MPPPVGPVVDRGVLVGAVAGLVVVLLALAVALLTGRWWRRRTEARRARRLAPGRPLLVALAAGDGDDAVLDRLATLPRAQWRALEPVAVSMLGKLRGGARAAIVALLERRGTAVRALHDSRRRRPTVRARAAHLLGVVGGPGATARLVVLLADRDPDVRAVAARALGRLRDPLAAQPLVRCLTGPGRALPHHVVMPALARVGPPARSALVASADHPDPAVRARVAEALGLIGAVDAAPRLVRTLQEDPSAEVRLRAARALGRLGTPSAVDPLLAATAAHEPPALRATAAHASGAIGARRAVPVLAALVDDPQHWVAHTAAAALAAIGPEGVAALRDLAHAADRPGAAAHAREALGKAPGVAA